MSSHLEPNDFIDDPMFKDLRAFGAKSEKNMQDLPPEVLMAYRNAAAINIRKIWLRRSIFSLLALGIALPSLSYAQLLPTPVAEVVKSVTNFVTAPIRVVTEKVSKITNSNPPEQNLVTTPDTTTVASSPTPSAQPALPNTAPAQATPTAPIAPAAPTHRADHHEGSKATPTKPKISSSEEEGEGHESLPQTGSSAIPGAEEREVNREGSNETSSKLPTTTSQGKPSISGGAEAKSESKKSSEKSDD